jgi:hypothetical protein
MLGSSIAILDSSTTIASRRTAITRIARNTVGTGSNGLCDVRAMLGFYAAVKVW